MKKLIVILLFITLGTAANAQFYQILNTTGTSMYGGIGVTTVGVGTPAPPTSLYSGGTCGVVNTFAITGGGFTNGFKYSFAKPITRIRLKVFDIQPRDTLTIFINGAQYILTAANVSYITGTCIVSTPCIATAAGKFTVPSSGPSCGDANYNGHIDIAPNYLIDSFRTLGNTAQCYGIVYNPYFAADTFVYIKQPFTVTSLCPGDTFKVPYYVSDYFNTSNTFTVQLSNAAGSFASPVNIGTKTANTNDSITCVIPRTTAAGTGYRVRIVANSPVATSFDNGTNIQIKALAANRIVSSNSPICEPDTVRLASSTTTGGVTYSWAGPAGFSSSLQNPKTNATTASANSGNYIVTMTTTGGCKTYDTTVVTVKPLPAKPTATNNGALCSGSTLNLTSNSTTTGVTYSWTGPNGFASGSQNPSKAGVTTADNGNFIVTATLNGCSMKDTTVLTVYAITATPTAGNTGPYCTGSDVQLTATNILGATYTWTGPSFSSTTQNPVIQSAALSAAGTYTVYATINGCNSNTTSTTVSIVNGPTVNIYPSPKDSICGNPTGTATFNASSAGGAGYQWYKNNTAITGATGSSYAATGILNGDEYYVKLIPGTGAACTTPVNSNKIKMTVLPYIVPAVDITVSPDSTAWAGVMLTFTATAANAGNNPKYQWKLNNANVTGAISNTWGAPNLNDKDKVSCEVTSSYICPQPQKVLSNVIGLKIKTGIGNIATENIKIYPNPTQTTLTVEGVTKGTSIQLKDVLGRQVISTIATDSKTVLNTAALPTGNYLLVLTGTDGTVMSEILVKE